MALGAQLDSRNGEALWEAPSVTKLFKPKPGEKPAEPVEGVPPLTGPWKALVGIVSFAVIVLGLIGLVISFETVRRTVEPSFGSNAWQVPLAIDVGILVFSALDLVLARLNMRVSWLRLVPWSLIGATIYLNVVAEGAWYGRVAHAVLPALWAVAVEVGIHAVRTRADLASGDTTEGVPVWRWILAPLPTVLLWRRMKLWRIRKYADALRLEQDRILVLTSLQDRYGLLWRASAPRYERALYRLGRVEQLRVELTKPGLKLVEAERRRLHEQHAAELDRVQAEHTAELENLREELDRVKLQRQTSTAKRTTTQSKRTTTRAKAPVPTRADFEPGLADAALDAGRRLRDRGERIVRDTLGPELRAADVRAGNDVITSLTRLVQAELAGEGA